MSSEERFIKIENALSALAEHQARYASVLAEQQARHAEEISELRATQKVMTLAIAKVAEMQQETTRNLDVGIKQLREEMRESQRITDEKLHVLIDTVDRIIRDRGSRP